MTDSIRLHNRHRLLAAIAALPLDAPPRAVEEACEALRNTLSTGSAHEYPDGREVGIIYEHIKL